MTQPELSGPAVECLKDLREAGARADSYPEDVVEELYGHDLITKLERSTMKGTTIWIVLSAAGHGYLQYIRYDPHWRNPRTRIKPRDFI